MNFSKLIILFLVLYQSSYSQISDLPKNYTKVENLEYIGNITFYYDNKTQTVLALKNDKVKWKVNATDICGKLNAKKSKIKYFELRGEYFEMVYKHKRIHIKVETGEATCEIKEAKVPIY